MAKKKDFSEVSNKVVNQKFEVVNRTERMIQVPIYNEDGEVVFLHLRLQGRGGQQPPVISEYQISNELRELVKSKLVILKKFEQ